MSKIELFILTSLGFLAFLVLSIRVSFFFNITVSYLTLPISLAAYSLFLTILFGIVRILKDKSSAYLVLVSFIAFIFSIGIAAFILGKTYDISWDGQGYHQSAVIALSSNWNPLKDPSIDFEQKLPSQIFAEGYPSALWEIESAIYSHLRFINSAKVVNIFIAAIAFLVSYSLLRKLAIGKILSIVISVLVVLQPIYMLQVLTFMQDGFGYELLIIAVASLAVYALSKNEYWSITVFLLAEIFLVSTKYSNLPIALILGLIFGIILVNRIFNKEVQFTLKTNLYIAAFICISLLFATLPYIRNQIVFNAAFYPTNIPELIGSVKYNNIPLNISNENKVNLLFYGIFSKSQPQESGDPRNEKNIASLKIPFTFTYQEIKEAGGHFNNRVGAGGALFSGIVVSAIILLFFSSISAKTRRQRYAVYVGYFSFVTILLLALLAPTPNLLRYVNQLQLLPFVVVVPILATFKKPIYRISSILLLLLISINVLVFSLVVAERNIQDTQRLNKQFVNMKKTGGTYNVRAQQFYSNYVILGEQKVPFTVVNRLECANAEKIVTSSTTTQFCLKK